MEITNLYREIGRLLHKNGAQRVALISSKKLSDDICLMKLEIAVDGSIDAAEATRICSEKWENIHFTIIDLNDLSDVNLINEVIEDGILL